MFMALNARLAALYLSGWPWVLRQSVCRGDSRCESARHPPASGSVVRVGEAPSHQTQVGAGEVGGSCQAPLGDTAPKWLSQAGWGDLE